ncbi:MAG: hypothetical protein IPJ94_29140 [Chloroflexi bacterium]|nr:hypothetical protein [Chloroflexota bacterium]
MFPIALTAVGSNTPISSPPASHGSAAYEADIALNQISIDDGRTDQNPLVPMPYLDPDVTCAPDHHHQRDWRIPGYGFAYYRVQPTGLLTFTQSSPRVNTAVSGDLRFASMNVLNYFTPSTPAPSFGGPSQDTWAAAAQIRWTNSTGARQAAQPITGIDADILGPDRDR